MKIRLNQVSYYVGPVEKEIPDMAGPFDNYEQASAEWCRQYLKKIHVNKRGKKYKIKRTIHPFAERHQRQEQAWKEADWTVAPSF